jgi:hypothetical protein
MGFQIRTNNVSSPVNNNYGLKIDAQSGGTNTWALKTETGIVQFGDKTMLAASTANGASLNIPSGTAPSSPAAGDVWNDGTNLIVKTGGVVKPLAFADSVTTSVATETTRATAAEATLTTNLATANTAITGNTSNISANASAIAAEVTRAQAVEANLRVRGIAYVAGCDSCNLLQTNDSEKTIYMNVVGAMTINQVTCFSDAGSPTINLQRDDGFPANILSADLACSSTGAVTTGIVSAESVLNLNDKIDFYVTSAGGSAHRVTVVIKTTLN